MLDHAALFVALAQTGSFTAAAKGRGMSPVTLARRIAELERHLGIILLLRDTHGVRLTAQGQRLLKLVGPDIHSVTRSMAAAAQMATEQGRLPIRISGTEPVLAEVLAPRLPDLYRAAPGLRIDLRVETGTVDLSASEAEVALRFAKPVGNNLRVRRLTTFQMGVWGHVDHPHAFAQARFVGYDDSFGDIAERNWMRAAGVEPRTDVVTSSTRSMLEIVRSGLAVAVLPNIIAQRNSDLMRLSGAPAVPPRPLWMLVHPNVARQKEVR
jgi:DNA-binding transcriptional LysR family regulator